MSYKVHKSCMNYYFDEHKMIFIAVSLFITSFPLVSDNFNLINKVLSIEIREVSFEANSAIMKNEKKKILFN